MSLKIYLLGQFKLQANNLPIELPSRPAQSLLAYLAINSGIIHRREKLAALLWSEASEHNARGYLRQALWRIRKSLEGGGLHWEDYLETTDLTVVFKEHSDFWLDANYLMKPGKTSTSQESIEAVQLYRGELLPGFYEEWVVSERERVQSAYHQRMTQLLDNLLKDQRWEEALQWAEEWIRNGYAPEPAFRALLRAYAGLGDQSMLNTTYQRCVNALERELGLEPSPETRNLYESICKQVRALPGLQSENIIQLPLFLQDVQPNTSEIPVFVSREPELAKLNCFHEKALAGGAGVVFITGEAGSGKSTLVHEFTRRRMGEYPNLIAASGYCNAHTGIGDPFLPFREILGSLTGDVEARWAAGSISKEHACRLWNSLPRVLDALVESGPDLLDTFIPTNAVLNRAEACMPGEAGCLEKLRETIRRQRSTTMAPGPQQMDLFNQYARVLKAISMQSPLVLVLDDLQWADDGSVNLLFHLVRQLAGSPILIVGVYRVEEVEAGRDGSRHPLKPMLNEFQREFGDITLNLGQAENQDFVEALLECEPNQLGQDFRQMLCRQTQGHPLFTIELLRGMQERGDLVHNSQGQWIEGPQLNWDRLPARVEAVIAERIGRLAPHLQTMLQAASVEGEVFTAEALAQVLHTPERELLTSLSSELDKKHRLVRAERIQRVGERFLSSYRFRNIVFQKYLYGNLDEVERVHCHAQVGVALETLYTSPEERMQAALQLARHFEEAGILEKAILYLHQAGERAIRLSGYQEGIHHLNRGMELLMKLPDSPGREQQELLLQLAIGKASKYEGPSPQTSQAIHRAYNLCKQLGKPAQLTRVLGELCIYHYVRAEYPQALEFGREALHLAQQAQDPVLEAEGHWYLGFLQFCLGDYSDARLHLQHVIHFYDPRQHHRSLVALRGVDAGLSAMAYDSCCLWCLGTLDQAQKTSQEALLLAYEFNHQFTLADVLCYAGCMLQAMRRDPQALAEKSEALIQISVEKNLPGWLGMATSCRGEALVMMGQTQAGIAEIRRGLEISEGSGVKLYKPIALRSLAKALLDCGCIQEGKDVLRKVVQEMEHTGERHWEAELHRLQAEFRLVEGNILAAEDNLVRAIKVAQEQKAKSWELQAATDLARLYQKQAQTELARHTLEPITGWFSPRLESPDLKAARDLLRELG